MPVTEKYTLFCVTIGSTQINQVKDFTVSPNVQKMFEYGSGSVDATFAAFDGETPMLQFTSTAIKRVLAAVDINAGQAIASPGTLCKFYFQQMAPGGTRKTGSTALCLTLTAGIAVVSNISAQDGQGPATIRVDVYGLSADGETSPIAVATGVALPTLAATDQLYTVGPATIGGTEVESIESFTYDPKINVKRNRGGGEAFPTFGYILRRGSEQDGANIVLTTRNISRATAGTTASLVPGTDVIFLRSLKAGSHREAKTAAKHIAFAPNGGAYLLNQIDSRDGDEASLQIDVSADRGSSSYPFTVTVDQTIEDPG